MRLLFMEMKIVGFEPQTLEFGISNRASVYSELIIYVFIMFIN